MDSHFEKRVDIHPAIGYVLRLGTWSFTEELEFWMASRKWSSVGGETVYDSLGTLFLTEPMRGLTSSMEEEAQGFAPAVAVGYRFSDAWSAELRGAWLLGLRSRLRETLVGDQEEYKTNYRGGNGVRLELSGAWRPAVLPGTAFSLSLGYEGYSFADGTSVGDDMGSADGENFEYESRNQLKSHLFWASLGMAFDLTSMR
jgi:hypothetical protein